VTTDGDHVAYATMTNETLLPRNGTSQAEVKSRVPHLARAVAANDPPPAITESEIEVRARAAQPGNGILRTRLLVSDLLATALCWIGLGLLLPSSVGWVGRIGAGLAAMLVTLVVMRMAGLYRSRLCARRAGEVGRVFVASLCGAGSFVAIQWSIFEPGFQVVLCGGACVTVVSVFRWHYTRWLHGQRGQGRYLRRVILVGANDDAASLITMLSSEPELGLLVSGVIGGRGQDPRWDRLPGVDSVADLPSLARLTCSSGVLIVPNALTNEDTQRVIAQCASSGLHVQIWPGFFGVGNRRLRQVPVAGAPFFYLEPQSDAAWPRAVKRVLDFAGSLITLIVSAPILAVAALAVALESRGGIFHSQKRVGLGGEVFTVYKLRTMRPPSREGSADVSDLNMRTGGPLFKAHQDPRVTRAGRLLRASSIDELPQLFNVLQGKMSLVGPRPALPEEAEQFDDELQRRHTMRPGITGLWQIEARENPSFSAYRRWDLHYVDNWSLGLDLSILLATVPVAATHAMRAIRRHPKVTAPTE
jgi:exopolysaccharide biosynthesis polyprenyl glycosylphosphotransferase